MVDALCLDDLDRYGRELDDPLEELYQDLYHRLLEDPGTNIDDPDRGVGIASALSGVINEDELAHRIKDDFSKDDRVSGTSVAIAKLEGGVGRYSVKIHVVTNDATLGIEVTSDGAGGVTVVRT